MAKSNPVHPPLRRPDVPAEAVDRSPREIAFQKAYREAADPLGRGIAPGMVAVYNAAGEVAWRWSVDAREYVACGEWNYVTEAPEGGAPLAAGGHARRKLFDLPTPRRGA